MSDRIYEKGLWKGQTLCIPAFCVFSIRILGLWNEFITFIANDIQAMTFQDFLKIYNLCFFCPDASFLNCS